MPSGDRDFIAIPPGRSEERYPATQRQLYVTAYVSENGDTVATYEYDAFGATISQSGMMADTFRHRFSTKPWIAALCVYDYGERVYSPELRRWLSRDPIDEEGGVNLYAMCENNPINKADFYGLLTQSFEIRKYNYTTSSTNFGEVRVGFRVRITCECKKPQADIWMNVSYYIADRDASVWNGWPRSYPNEKVPENWKALSYREKRKYTERHEDKHVYWYKIYYNAAIILLKNLEAHTFSSDKACQSYSDVVTNVLNDTFSNLERKQKEHDELWEKLK